MVKSTVGSLTVTVALACAVAPLVSFTVSITVVMPCGYGPAGDCVSVIGSPSGSLEPLSMLALALPPGTADVTVTLWASAIGTWFAPQVNVHAGNCKV